MNKKKTEKPSKNEHNKNCTAQLKMNTYFEQLIHQRSNCLTNNTWKAARHHQSICKMQRPLEWLKLKIDHRKCC